VQIQTAIAKLVLLFIGAAGSAFGYPLRLRTSTKLGYKNAKWIKAIEVTNDFSETYWSERGFNWTGI
jgi:DMSO/TMAO reductase YedYZ molybdopterin-dependent catalytic subunit